MSYIIYRSFGKEDNFDEIYNIKPLNPVELIEYTDRSTQTVPQSYSPMRVVEHLSPNAKYYFVQNKFPSKRI